MRKISLLALLFFLLAQCAFAVTEAEFDICKADLESQAKAQGISINVREAVFPALKLQSRVLELDQKQPEYTQTFDQYFKARVTDERIKRGRELYDEHKALLQRLTQRYGIPGQYLVAFWGLETNFGSYLGNMPTLDSLATLACDQRRSDYFTSEFINALSILQQYQLEPQKMRGSWAGAVGHVQFMPSTYTRFAIDGDGDGSVNLWGSIDDALASAANYLSAIGWNKNQRWGREVILPGTFNYFEAALSNKQPLVYWRNQGIKTVTGALLPLVDMNGAVLLPLGSEGPAFLVYDNFDVMMQWNRSVFYALSVGHLADRITGLPGLARAEFPPVPRLSAALVAKLQSSLNQLGYDAGEPDGIIGSKTRISLRKYQQDTGLIADGFPNLKTLKKLGLLAADN